MTPVLQPHLEADADPASLSLALQGGGSFGAFTWGVLDRLLEDPEIGFEALSGASAGAVNAALLASGLLSGGREGARATLRRFWTKVSEQAPRGLLGGSGGARMAFDVSSRMVSPYQFNPLGLNPLRALLSDAIDFAALRAASPVRLLIGATRVADGSLRVFGEDEISVEVLLASTCLPLMHHAVEIEGESYWDGGYAANPPLLPLVEATRSSRILLVQIVPMAGDTHPTTSPEIVKRLGQIAFNAALLHDVESIAAMQRIADSETALGGRLASLRLDRVAAEDWVPDLERHSVLDLDAAFIASLRESGRAAAESWLAARQVVMGAGAARQ